MNDTEKAAWLSARCGKLTASRMSDAMDYRRDGQPGAKLIALAKELLAERMTGDSVPHYVDARMMRGLEKEPAMKAEYELRTGNVLVPCGFIDHPTIPECGATPDSLLDDDAVFEGKAPDTTTHIDYMLAGNVVPERYQPQVLLQLACTGRSRVVFCSFDDRVKNSHKRLHVVEWVPPRERIEEVEDFARKFLAIVDRMWEQLNQEAA